LVLNREKEGQEGKCLEQYRKGRKENKIGRKRRKRRRNW
jgi:hypothetical protein